MKPTTNLMHMTRRRFLASGIATVVSVGGLLPAEGFIRGGAASGGGAAAITTFGLVNFSASNSKCRYRRGVWFAKGDIPSGYVPVVTRGATPITAQFDERNYWSDGSLKIAVMAMMDTDFTSGLLEVRSYTISKQLGSYDNTSLRTLADVTGAHTLQVTFNSVTNYLGATYGSGAFTADFTTQSGVTTRTYKYHSGPVCTSWEVWGMATDDSGGSPDSHLKTVWYVTAWNNPDGTLNDVEYGAVVALDWWSVAGKTLLNYNAVLKDATSTINTYSSVVHPYQAHWMTVRQNNDANHARRFWASTIPTLYHTFDKGYARSTGCFGYLDPAFTPNSNSAGGYTANYVPGSAENHRAQVDGTGGYQGRGLMPDTDCRAWMRQTSSDYRYARTSAFAGLHIPYHYHSNANRTISSGPQAGTDVANTVISLKMRPLSSAAYDFTAQGMPAAIDAYIGSVSGGIAATYVAKLGGDGPIWQTSGDASHAVAYSLGMYLLEGERHFMQATLDLGTNCAHQQNGNTFGGAPQAAYFGVAPFQTLLSIPATQYSGIASQFPNQVRSIGWGMMCVADADLVCPDGDVQAGFVNLYRSQQAVYTVFSASYMEASQISQGIYSTEASTGLGNLNSPWMSNFQVIGHAFNAIANEDTNSRTLLNNCIQYAAIAPWESGTQYYRSSNYRQMMSLKSKTTYDRVTNPLLARSAMLGQAKAIVTSNVLNIGITYGMDFTDGDIIYFVATDDSGNVVSIPTGFSEAVQYFAVNSSGQTCEVAATLGGVPLSIANGTYSIGCQFQRWAVTPAQNPPYLPDAASYPPIANAALIMASKAGASAVTPTHLSRAAAFVAPISSTNYAPWKMTS